MWEDFRKYNLLVDNNLAPALTCPNCQAVLILINEPDAIPDLRLWCSVDDTNIVPGLELHQQIMNYVRMFFNT